VRKWFAALEGPEAPELAVVEAALIIEAGYNKELDKVIVCWCRPEQQIERLEERGLAVEDARRRMAAQMPMEEKRRLANEQIDCSGSIEETKRQVDVVLERLQQMPASGRNIS